MLTIAIPYVEILVKVKVKRYSSSWQVISELRGFTCHMGSHSVTCYPTQVNSPRLTPARQAGTRFTYPGGMEGWVDLGDLLHTEIVYRPQTVTHPSTNRTQCRLTSLIKPTPLTTTLRRWWFACSQYILMYSPDGTRVYGLTLTPVWGDSVGVGVESCEIMFLGRTSYSLVQTLLL